MLTNQNSVSRRLTVRLFDAGVLGGAPLVAGLLGYRFIVGSSPDLVADAKRVHREVWSSLNVSVPADVAHFGERYDRALKSVIVAYHRGKPVGALGLYDMRIASITLDYEGCSAPADLDLSTALEIGKLAILPKYRGNGQFVMGGLMITMYEWCLENGVKQLFSGSKPRLVEVYQRFNPAVRLVSAPRLETEDPVHTRYFESLRSYGGVGCMFVFDLSGGSPWDVLVGCLQRGQSSIASNARERLKT